MNRLFGTDGIRGEPGIYPLDDKMLFRIGQAVGFFLTSHTTLDPSNFKIVIGKDTRISSSQLENSIAKGLLSSGINVILCGVIPTPGLSFLTRELKADLGIMISASHNVASQNGIKFFGPTGFKLSADHENQIEEILFNMSGILVISDGKIKDSAGISQLNDGQSRYISFLKQSFPNLNLKGFKMVIDSSNGAVSSFAPNLFRDMGAKVLSLNDSPNGTNINLNCGSLYPKVMAKAVIENSYDLGLSFDGDADRVILCDERGKILDGDYIMAIIGLYLLKSGRLEKDTLVATVMSNYGLQEAIENSGGKLIRAKVGDKYVLEELLKNRLYFGGEQSGHIISLKHAKTPDALITALLRLDFVKNTKKRLSQLSSCMRKFPQVLINVGVKEKRPFEDIPEFSGELDKATLKLNNSGRILVRYSGTESVARIMVEGKDKELINSIANNLAGVIGKG